MGRIRALLDKLRSRTVERSRLAGQMRQENTQAIADRDRNHRPPPMPPYTSGP